MTKKIKIDPQLELFSKQPVSTSELPRTWAVTSLESILEPLHDGRILHQGWSPRCHPHAAPSDDEWGVLKTTAIQDGEFQPEHNKHLPDKLEPRSNIEVKKGDLLITCAGPRARCGVPCFVRNTRPKLMLSGKIYRFRVNPQYIDPRFLEGWLRTPTAQESIDRMKTGINDSGLNLTHGRFLPLEVRVAPVAEQHRIVESVESYLTRLDDAIVTLERTCRNLKRYRASVLNAAVEGRLVATEVELARRESREHEPSSELLKPILVERRECWIDAYARNLADDAHGRAEKKGEHFTEADWQAYFEKKLKAGRKKYEEPTPPTTDEMPELPEGWCWTTMETLTVWGPQNGIYVPKSQYGRGTPILRIDDYQVDHSRASGKLQRIDISTDDKRKYGLRVGDIVINRVNSPSHLGKSLAVQERNLPAVFESNMMRLRLSTHVLSAYLQHYLSSVIGKSRLIENAKWAVNQASINQSDVGSTLVPLPPMREQQRIVDEIERLLSTSQNAIKKTRSSQQRCQHLQKAILKWAFEGRLVDQDPSDEPAETLLARMRIYKDQS